MLASGQTHLQARAEELSYGELVVVRSLQHAGPLSYRCLRCCGRKTLAGTVCLYMQASSQLWDATRHLMHGATCRLAHWRCQCQQCLIDISPRCNSAHAFQPQRSQSLPWEQYMYKSHATVLHNCHVHVLLSETHMSTISQLLKVNYASSKCKCMQHMTTVKH